MTPPFGSNSPTSPTLVPRTLIRWKVIFLIPLFLYLAYLVFLFTVQHSMIFPRGYISGDPDAKPDSPTARAISLPTPDGPSPAWFFPALNGGKTVALIAHGNAELAGNWFDTAAELASSGIGALVVEFPGYGNAPGSPSQKSIAHVFDAAYDFLADQNQNPPLRIVGLGSSVGAAVLCDLSTRRDLAALALISPFRNLKAMAARHLAPPFLLLSPFDNASALSQFKGRALIFHGTRDSIIPFADGASLASLNPNFELVPVQSDHNDIHAHWDSILAPRIRQLFLSLAAPDENSHPQIRHP